MKQGTEEKRLEELAAQIPASATDELLYAGLAVLARDLYLHLEKKENKDILNKAKLFPEAVREVQNREMKELAQKGFAFPSYEGVHPSDLLLLPSGLAEKSESGQLDLSPLFNPTPT